MLARRIRPKFARQFFYKSFFHKFPVFVFSVVKTSTRSQIEGKWLKFLVLQSKVSYGIFYDTIMKCKLRMTTIFHYLVSYRNFVNGNYNRYNTLVFFIEFLIKFPKYRYVNVSNFDHLYAHKYYPKLAVRITSSAPKSCEFDAHGSFFCSFPVSVFSIVETSTMSHFEGEWL